MVIAQPHLSLTPDEPYRCTVPAKTQQLAVLNDTLAVARTPCHGADKTHFTIFPEYSLPGLDGITLVEDALREDDWPKGTFAIGGTDALSKPDFVALANAKGTHLTDKRDTLRRIAQTEWINCGITWVKADDGTVERWLQPKLFPASAEQDILYQGMFRGNSVFTFKGPLGEGMQYCFSSIICFDWVATLHNQKAWRWVMEDLKRQVAPGEVSLTWFFVIQHNPKPSHDSFLAEVSRFFDQNDVRNVRRDRTCLVFANSAGKPVPGRTDHYGATSLIFSRQNYLIDPKCHPTFSNGGRRFRSSESLLPYHDVFFRERGACIHSFSQINPGSLSAGATGKSCAIEYPFVFPMTGVTDPRAPAGPVPACVKWLNDELDGLHSLTTHYPTAPLAAEADTAHGKIVTVLRAVSPQSVTHMMKLAAGDYKTGNADDWDQTEMRALEHLVHTLDIISLGFTETAVGNHPAHATVVMDNQTVDLLVIRAESHESCLKHSEWFLPLQQRKVLLISRDRDNNPLSKRVVVSFLQPVSPRLGQDRNITDPASGSLHLGYRTLLDIFQRSTTTTVLQGEINAELAA